MDGLRTRYRRVYTHTANIEWAHAGEARELSHSNMPTANCYLTSQNWTRYAGYARGESLVEAKKKFAVARSGPLAGADGPNLHQP